MNKIQHILIIMILLESGCSIQTEELEYDINYQPVIEKINYNSDSLILYELSNPYKQQKNEETEFRGIDSYSCTIDSINGLEINMSFGFMSGQTFTIQIQNDTLLTKHRSWGCTSHEDFRYETIQQEIILNSPINNLVDSITGYISYVGLQDIEHKIQEWESYGENSDWLVNLKPQIARINGQFKLRIYNNQNDYSHEYDRSVIYRKKQFKSDLYDAKEENPDSLNCSRMNLELLPKGLLDIKSIRKLNLEANNLENLDFNELAALPNLERIYLGWNKFRKFPLNLTKNKNLIYVNLRGNPIESIPIEELLNSNIRYLNLKGSKLDRTKIQELTHKMKVEI